MPILQRDAWQCGSESESGVSPEPVTAERLHAAPEIKKGAGHIHAAPFLLAVGQ